jgi:hypothetical protein
MTVSRRALAPLLVTVALSACDGAPPSVESPSASVSPAPPSTPSQEPTGLIDPGQPYSADDILDAMRSSRRPGGVPDDLETEAIAASLADAVWTFDGRPYDALAIGGSCGPAGCSLDLVGTRAGSSGEDVWSFAEAGGEVTVVAAELGATPDGLASRLDALAHELVPAGYLDGLLLTSTRWLPPPDTGAFVLAYRSGEEEGSCEIDIVLDAAERRVVAADDPC